MCSNVIFEIITFLESVMHKLPLAPVNDQHQLACRLDPMMTSGSYGAMPAGMLMDKYVI